MFVRDEMSLVFSLSKGVVMKRFLSITAIALITGSCFAPAANAQFAFGINQTQAQLQSRITAGIRTGALSRSEAGRLQSKLQRFAQLEQSLRRSNRHLSYRERNKLNAELARLNADITRQLTDSERRWNSRFNHNRPGWHHR
jgi:hypothetical protein